MADDYPLLRASLAPPYADLGPDQLLQLVQAVYGPGATPEDVEGFFSDIGRGFKKAAGAVGGFAKTALPGMLSGAMTGASVGGPWGALVGAVAGGAGSALSKSKNKTARSLGGLIGGAGNMISTVRGGGAGRGLGSLASIGSGLLGGGRKAIAAQPAGGGGANALMGMLSRPETLQALLSGAMGSFGRQAIPVGGQEIPVHAMLQALGSVADRAAQEAAEMDESAAESVPAYVEWAEAEFGIDADDAEGRTDAVLLALAMAPSVWANQSRPTTVNVTLPEQPYRGRGEPESVEDWEYDESWADGEDFQDWDGDEGESVYASA
jgi:hypothetical protein